MKIGKSGVRGLAAIFGAAFLAAAPAYAAPGCDSRKKGGADQCTLPLKTTGALSFTTRTPWFAQPRHFSGPLLRDVLAAAGPIAYAGVLSVGVAYTLQVIAQRDAPASHAAMRRW